MIDNQNSNNTTLNTELEKDCKENQLEVTESTSNNNEKDHNTRSEQNNINIPSNLKPSIPRYYTKNLGQITIKADKELVDSIKQIAKDEERTIQTVTNRLLEKALELYEHERDNYLK